MVAIRTSRCNASEKRLDDRSRNRERERFNELPLVPDKDSAMMCRERGHDVLMFQFAADEVLDTIELDASLGIDFSNPGDMPPGDRQGQMTVRADVVLETNRAFVSGRGSRPDFDREAPSLRIPGSGAAIS